MTLFEQIALLSLTDSDIQNLSPQKLIRLEKIIKSQLAFGDPTEKNEKRKVLEVLRKHSQELLVLYGEDFTKFREVLVSNGPLLHFKVQPTKTDYPLSFQLFVKQYLAKDIRAYIERCFQSKDYKALFSFMAYCFLFDGEIEELLSRKLEQKLTFGLESLRINTNNITKKVVAISHPDFFRIISVVDPLHFEESIRDLINSTVGKRNLPEFNYRVLFAVGSYQSSNTALDQVIKENKAVARNYGVKESHRGGTYVNNIHKEASERGGGRSWGTILWIAFVIIMILRRVVSFGGFNSSNDYPSFNSSSFDIEELYKERNTHGTTDAKVLESLSKYREKEEESNKKEQVLLSPYDPNGPKESKKLRIKKTKKYTVKVLEYQYLKEKNARVTPYPFSVKNTILDSVTFARNRYQGLPTVYFKNNTKKNMLLRLCMEDGFSYHVYLKRNSKVNVPKIVKNFVVYTGVGLEKVSIRNEEKKEEHYLRFKKFTEKDKVNLNRFVNVSLKLSKSKGVEIFIKDVKNEELSFKSVF